VAREYFVARGLAPVGLRSGPPTFLQKYTAYRFYDGFAAERGQALSPQI